MGRPLRGADSNLEGAVNSAGIAAGAGAGAGAGSRPSGGRLEGAHGTDLMHPVSPHWSTALTAGILAGARLTRILDRWNGRNGGIVFVFHEITRARMEEQLEVAAASYTFVSLTALVDRLEAGQPTRGMAAITLDDGVGTVSEDAAEISLRRGWPMTFYLPTGAIDQGRPAWYHELPARLHAARGHRVTIAGATYRLDTRAEIDAAIAALTARFCACANAAAVQQLVQAVRVAVGSSTVSDQQLSAFAPLTWNRVAELARHEELSFEAHSVSHLAMSRLTAPQVESEMRVSRDRVQSATGRPVRHFCYPYGAPNQIGAAAASIARQLFRSAVTMERGRCTRHADLAMLPRVPLYQTDTAHTVAAKIALAR
jgi:peptidoglycan/xylan/chitin deacetylase (PgdA/CDA1 family)